MDLSYVESFSPGNGYLPARASQAGGSVRVSLDGTWKFRYGRRLSELTPGFEAADFDDAGFDDLAVPSMWQLAGLQEFARRAGLPVEPAFAEV